MFHRSRRLLLRPIWPEDWQALMAGIADEGVARNLALAPWPYQEGDARAFAARPVEPLFPRFLITRAQDAQVIGCIGIEPAGTPGAVTLGCWIARRFWGQGYATEAGEAVLSVAEMLGHGEAEAWHFLDNPASGKVLRKLGFEPTGRVEERWSRARGGKAPSAHYRRDLAAMPTEHQRAA
ncbi:MAG: GNAT family N-acetyltransferase [Erythrobacter sp.]